MLARRTVAFLVRTVKECRRSGGSRLTGILLRTYWKKSSEAMRAGEDLSIQAAVCGWSHLRPAAGFRDIRSRALSFPEGAGERPHGGVESGGRGIARPQLRAAAGNRSTS